MVNNAEKKLSYSCRADEDSYPHDRRADKGRYRPDSRADKNPYRHDRRADSLSQAKILGFTNAPVHSTCIRVSGLLK